VWTNRKLKIKHENGPGSSPVLWKDLLLVHCDGSDQQYLAALDKKTGELVWRKDRTGKMNGNPQLKKAYGTPLVVEVAGKPVVFSPAADWLYAYDPTDGKELWKLNYGVLGFSIVPRPVAGHGMLYMCTSFMQSELLAIRYDEADKEPRIVWRFGKQAPQMPSPLLIGNEIYVVSDKGVATCLDAHTGEVRWTERLGGNFCASPLYVDGRIYFSNREGLTTVVEPGRTYKLLSKNDLKEGIMASPAAIDGALVIRTDKALYRLGK
jgi:outer membrane protein assembly factor BamB